jgi:tripartite-type tricarboxylate transporter receptor subunit TctC
MRMERGKRGHRFGVLSVLILTGILAGPRVGYPATFPTKPIEMTVLFGAGSGADLLARKLAEIAGKVLEQPILVVNRTGAGGAIGYNYLRGQAPDGYSIGWNSNSISTAYHAGNMNFDYTAFSGVAELTTEPVSLAVKSDAPWKDVGEFIAHAKKNPGRVRIGNSGRGSFTHLTGVALENKTGAKFTHVPFGQALAVAAVLGEKIEASIQLPAEIVSQVRGKQVRILAVTGDSRLPSQPDIPTFKEAGIDLTLSLWRGIAVPKGTPEPVIARLEAAFKAASESPEFRGFATQMGASIEFRGAKAFDQFMAAQDKELAELMDQIGMKK